MVIMCTGTCTCIAFILCTLSCMLYSMCDIHVCRIYKIDAHELLCKGRTPGWWKRDMKSLFRIKTTKLFKCVLLGFIVFSITAFSFYVFLENQLEKNYQRTVQVTRRVSKLPPVHSFGNLCESTIEVIDCIKTLK